MTGPHHHGGSGPGAAMASPSRLSRLHSSASGSGAVNFQSVNSDSELVRAMSSSTPLVQDLRDGAILFNQNGTAIGAGQGGVFAVMSQGLTLQVGDFALGA